ncbi:uncharacterized protein Dwil_GK27709 [Drosophila willistoni]|uniref:Uncharacterized protein n=1 Tax=Drosophila willistoni TaxID=7260 RepID=A0A0Q9X0S6_DROWI|nr:uncharacterized protein Dwil_GK27709 [Drosophila willistoni]
MNYGQAGALSTSGVLPVIELLPSEYRSRVNRFTVIIVVVVAVRAMSRLRRESSRQSVITVELIQFIIQYRAKETQEKKKRCDISQEINSKF